MSINFVALGAANYSVFFTLNLPLGQVFIYVTFIAICFVPVTLKFIALICVTYCNCCLFGAESSSAKSVSTVVPASTVSNTVPVTSSVSAGTVTSHAKSTPPGKRWEM